MAWVKIDDNIRTHPKFLKAGPAASWLWLCGQSYCGDYLTDGFIPNEALSSLGVKRAQTLSAKLIKVGLWTREPEGFRVHDYLDYQPSRAHVEHVRSLRKQAGKLGGLRSGEARHLQANGKQNATRVLEAKSNPVPSRPLRDLENRSRIQACPHTPACETAFLCAELRKLDRARTAVQA